MVKNLDNSRHFAIRLFWWTLVALFAAVLLFQTAFLIYYRDFYGRSDREFKIPGLDEDFVPQGLEACGDGHYLISGYVAGSGNSWVYYITRGGTSRKIEICGEDGEKLKSHSGGICTNGPFTYMAGGNGKCYVLASADLFDKTSDSARILGTIRTANAASFCCIYEDNLLVGEYEFGTRFQTPASHHLRTPAGDQNRGLIQSYPLNGNQTFGVEQACNAVYSIPSRAQGMCFTSDGRIVLSTSSYRGNSQLLFFGGSSVLEGRQGIYWIGETPVPLYYLDSDSCEKVIPMPPYSEETVFENKRLLILFESASSRFRFGKLIGGQYVYSMRIPARKTSS